MIRNNQTPAKARAGLLPSRADLARKQQFGVRFAFSFALAAVVALISSSPAHACSVCAGDPASPMTAGMNSAIWALLAVTGSVLSTFVGFFLFLWRRARNTKRPQIDTAWLDGLRGAKNV